MGIRLALLSDSAEAPIVKVEGDINILTADVFRDTLMNIVLNSNNNILVDCQALEYIDSYGLTVLAEAIKAMQQKELHINLCNVKKTIMKLLSIICMDEQVFAVC